MKSIFIYLFLSICCISAISAQTLNEAKELYKAGEFVKALPVFEAEHRAKPTDASLNQWYGACLFETGGDLSKAEECLLFASTKGIQESFMYLGLMYREQFRFEEANAAFDNYQALLTKKNPRKRKDEIAQDEAALERLEKERKILTRLSRMVLNTENIQIIDSLLVNKASFLSAYKMSISSGRIDYFNNVFSSNKPVESTVYFNEKETKIYYSQPDSTNIYTLFSMEKLIDKFGNEKKLSGNNFGLIGDVNYPYIMTDGVTIYFAAKDEEALGGYDLFVSRYNMNNDTYLAPERLSMPFNSVFNDYMMVVDEEKGVGWFASDRFQPEDTVCVYTFIPNSTVKIVDSQDEKYMASRARILSIKDSWIAGHDYTNQIALARKTAEAKAKVIHDFEFVINDQHTYYALADFKNKVARDTYFKVVQLRAELKSVEEKLQENRTAYRSSQPDGKRKMTPTILDLERRQEQIQREIPILEVQARNQEVQE